jgi:uncharacterized protein (DUF302 family)
MSSDRLNLAYVLETHDGVEEAVERLQTELKLRGFGVLAHLPVHAILKEKTGTSIDPLVILEVCSPPHALRAIEASRSAGLLLPCKIVVSREAGTTRLSLARPTVLLGQFLPVEGLEALGVEVERQLTEAMDAARR